MKLIDISMELHEQMQVYKNREEKKPKITKIHTSSGANEMVIEFNNHTGTHIDFPRHMNSEGKTLSDFPLEKFFGTACLLDFSKLNEKISKRDLENKKELIEKSDFVLLKTKNSNTKDIEKFDFEFIYLDANGAEYLSQFNLKGVGIDALGVERNQEDHPTHKILLGKEILIIEGLNLSKVDEQLYKIFAFPLKIKKADASPTRIVLLKEQ